MLIVVYLITIDFSISRAIRICDLLFQRPPTFAVYSDIIILSHLQMSCIRLTGVCICTSAHGFVYTFTEQFSHVCERKYTIVSPLVRVCWYNNSVQYALTLGGT